jgi:tetratricopeptide (TPR) repeat protein
MRHMNGSPWYRQVPTILILLLVMWGSNAPLSHADDSQSAASQHTADLAKAAWENGAVQVALEILDQGIEEHPLALSLQKLRGDILATSRRPQEAVQTYDTVLAMDSAALDVRWAKWSVLLRSGQADESIAELRRIAQIDTRDPLIHFRLAQELRKLDRLEESLESYQKAVTLAPDLLGWRLAMARARFDVLDYAGADSDVQYVLQKMPPGSPLEIPARTLLSLIDGTSTERGRRYQHMLTPDATEQQLKEWAAIRAEAWRLFSARRYREAEPLYRKMLALNPKDPIATYHLGLSLMQLGRCQEALDIFRRMSDLDPTDEDYADSVFRMGQCLVELERWEDAYVHFQILYDAAVEFEEANKGVDLPAGTRVLDKDKLARWLDKVRPHVPDLAALKDEAAASRQSPDTAARISALQEESLLAKAVERLKPQRLLETRASLMGRDADFSWFRFVIPAGKVMRDDFPTGAHEFIPLNPGDTFPVAQREIYLVFGLVSSSYDAVPLTVQCFLEHSEMTGEQRPVAQDEALTAMNDQSGYFMLSPPKSGWPPGLYRCGLFAGERTSAYTHVDEVRFRVLAPPRLAAQGF